MMPSDVFDISKDSSPTNSQNNQGFIEEKWQKIVLITSFSVLTVIIIFSFYMLAR
jgi:hypothetical protein